MRLNYAIVSIVNIQMGRSVNIIINALCLCFMFSADKDNPIKERGNNKRSLYPRLSLSLYFSLYLSRPLSLSLSHTHRQHAFKKCANQVDNFKVGVATIVIEILYVRATSIMQIVHGFSFLRIFFYSIFKFRLMTNTNGSLTVYPVRNTRITILPNSYYACS